MRRGKSKSKRKNHSVRKKATKKRVSKQPPLRRRRKIPPSLFTTTSKLEPNRIRVIFPDGKKDLEEIELLLLNFNWKPVIQKMQSHKKVNPLTKRLAYVPPKAFYVIFRLLKPKGVEQWFTTLSPHDMVVNLENIQDLTIQELINLFESWQGAHEVMESDDDDETNEAIEYMNKLDMRYLKEIIYHFIYNV